MGLLGSGDQDYETKQFSEQTRFGNSETKTEATPTAPAAPSYKGKFLLKGISESRLKRFSKYLEAEQPYEQLIGGKLHIDIGYLIIMSIPLWFHYEETFFFISEKGVYFLTKSLWKGVTETYFFSNESFSGIELVKNKLSRELRMNYDGGVPLNYNADSGSLLKFLGTNIDKIHAINPELSVTGDYIPKAKSNFIVEPRSLSVEPSNEMALEL